MSTLDLSISRRLFIKTSYIFPILGFMMPSTVASILEKPPRTASPIYFNPLAMAGAAKSAIDLIASFSGSKDSAIGAMMRYQTGLLNEIINKLNGIQTSLVEIQNAIDKLPEVIKQSLEAQYRMELISEIYGAVDRYLVTVLIPSSTNPENIKNPAVQEEIRDILNIVDQKIATLNNQRLGIGPEACMIAPLAMCLSVAARTNLEFPNSVIKSSLNRYTSWFDEILGEKPGSINYILKTTADHHDKILADLDENWLAKKISLNNFKLNGSQRCETIADPGLLMVPFELRSMRNWTDEFGATTRGNEFTKMWPSPAYKRYSTIETKLDSTVDAFLLSYKRTEPIIASRFNKDSYEANRPQVGDYLFIQPVPSKFSESASDIKILAESSNNVASKHNLSRELIIQAINKVNLDRATISFCAQARVVALQCNQRISDYLKLI